MHHLKLYENSEKEAETHRLNIFERYRYGVWYKQMDHLQKDRRAVHRVTTNDNEW